MPKLNDYSCNGCEELFEYLVYNSEDIPSCPKCKSKDLQIGPGGILFKKIVPTYTGSAKLKAGYQHKYVNRPAEKTSVSVPAKIK